MFSQVFICETPQKASNFSELMEVDIKPEPKPDIELVPKYATMESKSLEIITGSIKNEIFDRTETKQVFQLSQSAEKQSDLETHENEIKVPKYETMELEGMEINTGSNYKDILDRTETKQELQSSQSSEKHLDHETHENEIKVLHKRIYSSEEHGNGSSDTENNVESKPSIFNHLEKSLNTNVSDQKILPFFVADEDRIQKDENQTVSTLGKQLVVINPTIILNENRYIVPDMPPIESETKALHREFTPNFKENRNDDVNISPNSERNSVMSDDANDGNDSCSDWEKEYFFSSDKSKMYSKPQEQKTKTIRSPPSKYQSIKSTKVKSKTKTVYLFAIPVQNEMQSTEKVKELDELDPNLKNKIIFLPPSDTKQFNNIIPEVATTNIDCMDSELTKNNTKTNKNLQNGIKSNKSQQKSKKKGPQKSNDEFHKKLDKKVKITKASQNMQPKVEANNSTENNEEAFLCKICSNYFNSKSLLSYHSKYSLCGGYRRERNHQCDICGKLFYGLQKLQDHKNSHLNARPHKCTDCDKYFNSKITRHIHYKKMHQNIRVRHLCCYCGITSPALSHLLAHEETHRLPEGAEIPTLFKCLECGKGFISKFKLTKHMKEHKLKKCRVCSEEFFTYSQLRVHMENVHNIVKTYSCDKCTKTFKSAETLRSHKKSHSTAMSFFCDICGKGFKQRNHIIQHLITHSDERPISCPQCDETFKRKTHLKQHISSAHEGNNNRNSAAKKASKKSQE